MSEHQKSSAARVVVGVSGSPGSLTALARAAEEARRRGAQLWPVLAWEPPGGELGSRRAPVAADMVPQWELLARERLLKALRDVFGSTDTGVPGTALTVRGAAGPALVRIAEREDDVIVVGAGRRNRLLRALSPSVGRYCLAHAGCPVLAVPPSPLQDTLATMRRRNMLRLRLDTESLLRESEPAPTGRARHEP
ncbi:universal stress protein [Streptomyces nogalater]|uniref:Universal stress protein n=1 Tax=Streptomyces nogalater TaxID=38314 RepID=A0ABW0WJF4_STRNO